MSGDNKTDSENHSQHQCVDEYVSIIKTDLEIIESIWTLRNLKCIDLRDGLKEIAEKTENLMELAKTKIPKCKQDGSIMIAGEDDEGKETWSCSQCGHWLYQEEL